MKLYENLRGLGLLFIMTDNDMMMGFITPKIQLQQKKHAIFHSFHNFHRAGRMAALGCSAGGMLALRLLRAGLDLVAAVSPAPLDQDAWEQAEKNSEMSWVKRRLAGYELFN